MNPTPTPNVTIALTVSNGTSTGNIATVATVGVPEHTHQTTPQEIAVIIIVLAWMCVVTALIVRRDR